MADAVTIAVSGLKSADLALTRAAANIVNASSLGVDAPEPSRAMPPPAQSAPAQMPALDMATQIVSQMEAAAAFKANLAVYRTASATYRSLLRITG